MARLVTASVALAVVVAGCGATRGRSESTPPPSPAVSTPASAVRVLAALTVTGGICDVDGAGGVCSSRFAVLTDGGWRTSGTTEPRTGRLSATDLRRVRHAVATTGLAARERFTGVCPTAYDGSELEYSYLRGDHEISLSTCEWELDPRDVLARTLEELITRLG